MKKQNKNKHLKTTAGNAARDARALAALAAGAGLVIAAVVHAGPRIDPIQCPEGTTFRQDGAPCAAPGECDDAYQSAWCARPDGTHQGPYLSWFEHGDRRSPRAEGTYQDGARALRWTWWYRNGQKRSVGDYLEDRRHGPWSIWHDNGQLHEQGSFVEDRPHGVWAAWHDNGQRASWGVYDRGQRVGLWTTWEPDGALASRGFYRNGARHGLWWLRQEGSAEPSVACFNAGRPAPCP